MSKKIVLPVHVAACCDTIRQAGRRACPVGGCVRDSLLGRTPGDWDVCTSARPEEIMALFPRTVFTGGRHGTVMVLTDGGPMEVTPFRQEGGYSDGRHPDEVTFGVSLEEDLARRDFTINAMALDENGEIVDLFGGRADLERKLIRCVGDPDRRFSEDALRMFRAVRFAAQLGFELTGETAEAIRRTAAQAARLSPERVKQEVEKLLCSPHPGRVRALFAFGLMERWAEGNLAPVISLTRLPAEPLIRWARLCGSLLNSGAIGSAEAFLAGLRLERRVIRACAAGEALWRAGLPQDDRQWRRALARYGEESCRCAAAMEDSETLLTLEEVLAERPCVRVSDLALSGGDLAALGLSGPAIGEAQRLLLDRVLDRPEDNTAEILRGILAEQGHI